VFSVHPRSGHLDPGSTTTITLSFRYYDIIIIIVTIISLLLLYYHCTCYRNVYCGSSRLPVLLKIGGGREVLVSDPATNIIPLMMT